MSGEHVPLDAHAAAAVQARRAPAEAEAYSPEPPLARFDPVAFEVFRNAVLFATEEMAVTLRRAAYSTNIKTRGDFSCSIFDPQLRVVAQSHGLPNHLGQLSQLVPEAVGKYGADRIATGGAILVNDPYSGGGHLNDFVLISPIDCEGRRIGYVANQAHHVDVGGGAPASLGVFEEIFQEGIQIPPIALMEDGVIKEDVFQLILAQIRTKHETAGDLRAQTAANHTGIRRVIELARELGIDSFLSFVDGLLDYTERRTRAEIAKLPRGRCEADANLDDDGFTEDPVPIHSRIEIRADEIHFDLSDNVVQRPAPVNATLSQTFASCAYVVKCLIDTDIPTNDGFYRAISLSVPEGSVLHATYPAPVVGGWEMSTRLTEAHFKGLSRLMPEEVPAGTKGMICHASFGGAHPSSGDLYAYIETLGGGYGGRSGSDGPDAVQAHGTNTENAPVEEVELNYPVQILRYELVCDSEGAGRWRGGLGMRRDYAFTDHAPKFTILADRAKQAPWGLFGGQPGRLARYVHNPGGSEARELRSKTTVQLAVGDVVRFETCGGGGYGDPLERDPSLVANDVREEKVSLDRARALYGVVIDADAWTVQSEETARLRAALRRERQA